MKIKAQLTINLTYDIGDADPIYAKTKINLLLAHIPAIAAGNGLFTGEEDFEIAEWDNTVTTEILKTKETHDTAST